MVSGVIRFSQKLRFSQTVILNEIITDSVVILDAGKGNVDVTITDATGHKDKVKPTITPSKDGVYYVEYTAIETGLHSVVINFGGKQIPGSPFGVQVSPASNAKAVYATGRGIQPRGVRIKQRAEFKVHTKGAGTAEVKVQVIGPGNMLFLLIFSLPVTMFVVCSSCQLV